MYHDTFLPINREIYESILTLIEVCCCLYSEDFTVIFSIRELRLTEALSDPHVCDRILEYNVHKERSGSNRFAKGRSETMETLHGLR